MVTTSHYELVHKLEELKKNTNFIQNNPWDNKSLLRFKFLKWGQYTFNIEAKCRSSHRLLKMVLV